MVRLILFLLARHNLWLRPLSWFTRFGHGLFILYGLGAWFCPKNEKEQRKERKTLLYCLFSVILASSVSWFIGKLWYRPRPFARGKGEALVKHKANASFPSNHAMNSMAVAVMLLLRRNLWGLPALALSVILGVSRVLCRLHYVSDVLGGFVLGAGSGYAVYRSKRCSQLADRLLYSWHIFTYLLRVLLRR